MQPPKIGFSKKKSTILPTKYSAFFVENVLYGSGRTDLHHSRIVIFTILEASKAQVKTLQNHDVIRQRRMILK